jgi:hypothetical protein
MSTPRPMRFDTLEEIRRREARRSRTIRQRHREEHARKFAFKQQYDRAYRKAVADYAAVNTYLQSALTAGRDPNLPVRGTDEQKFLMVLLLAAEQHQRRTHQGRTPYHPFLLHLYTIAMVELQKSMFQTIRLTTGMPTLSVFRGITTWGALMETVERVGKSKADEVWKALKDEVSGRPARLEPGEVRDHAVMLAAEAGELQELLAGDTRFMFENASFLFHLQLKIGVDALGLGVALLPLATATSLLAAPLVIAGIGCMLGAANLYNSVQDLGEYKRSWDTEARSLRDSLGDTLGLIAESTDLVLGLSSALKSVAGFAQKGLGFERAWLKSALSTLDASKHQHPELAPLFKNINRLMAVVTASRTFFSDVVPKFESIATQDPKAAPDQLIRGILATGLSLTSLHTKAQDHQFALVAKVVADLWSVWAKGENISKGK